MTGRYDFAVIGAGLFGARLALMLARRGARVALIERERHICGRATYANQARVHNGYHYLRSYSTAQGSHKNYDRFMREMAECVDADFEHVYAISRQGTYTNASQFQRVCRELNLPIAKPSAAVRRMFNPIRIEDMFVVREAAFNARLLRAKIVRDLDAERGVAQMLTTECTRIDIEGGLVALATTRGALRADGVFIVAYADVNKLLIASGLRPLDLKAEIAELALVEVPPGLERRAITVMDGPFFSLMPMPAEELYSLSHVRYTPHLSWDLKQQRRGSSDALAANPRATRFTYMQHDAQRYVPEIANLRYRRSLFEVKAIPSKHELDDGRPIIFHRHSEEPPVVSVLGSKLDSVFELERAAETFLDARSLPEVV